MNIKVNLLCTVGAAAVLTAFGAAGALAQATAETEFGSPSSMALSGDVDVDNEQLLLSNTTSTTEGSTASIEKINTGATNDILSAALSGVDNRFSASATGNLSESTAVLAFSPSTAGDTAVVGSLQSANQVDILAEASGVTQSILVQNPDGGVRTFTGTALLDNNDTTASAIGNSSVSAIDVAAGLDVIQGAAALATADVDATLLGPQDNSAAGDLVVSSSQEINSTGNEVSSAVDSADTTVTIEDLNGGTVTVSASDQASSTSGNLADNRIVSDDTTATITGSAVVSNLQRISGSSNILAETFDSTISASAGTEADGTSTGEMLDSTISVSGNTQSSDATGNDSTQAIALDASNITGEAQPAGSRDSDAGTSGVQLSLAGDAVISNVQREDPDTVVRGETLNNTIAGSSSRETSTDPATRTSTISVLGNSQTASATGATTNNTLSLTSGATQSAAGVVSSVQNAGASSVSAQASDNTITATAGGPVDSTLSAVAMRDSSLLTTDNDIGSTATGATATNDLSVTNGTNNLSVVTNGNQTFVNNPGAGDQPNVVAGQIVTNDQSRAGLVDAISTDNRISSSVVSRSAATSTIMTDANSVSASATGQIAENGINLAFNALTGTISGTGTGTVASVANEQEMIDSSTVTARNAGTEGVPILTDIAIADQDFVNDAENSMISTSDNTVSAIARGNVTSGNDVTAAGGSITSGSPSTPLITASNGEVQAGGSFISASSQISGADILATQNDVLDETSNTVETWIGDSLLDSTLMSDGNLLISSATANTAANSVALGGESSALIDASGTVANFQNTTEQGSVTATLGTVAPPPIIGDLDGNINAGSSGVIARIDADGVGFSGATAGFGVGGIEDSTVSISDNILVGEATGNDATNAVSAVATTVAGPGGGVSLDPSNLDVGVTGAELANGNVQVNGSEIATDVIGTFAIVDDRARLNTIENSSQVLDNNLQQSFATANRATNRVDVTATNTNAATALESSQQSNAPVSTTSTGQVIANIGSENSSLDMTNNRNEAITNGNVASNSSSIAATNLDGGTTDASVTTTALNADNAVSSTQSVSESLSATAVTDVFNQDDVTIGESGTTYGSLRDGFASQSGNVSIAQGTGNVSDNSLALGFADTANSGRSGALTNVQNAIGTGTIDAVVEQSVRVDLLQEDDFVFSPPVLSFRPAGVPVQGSSISQDGNVTSALARSNVATNTVMADGANIQGGSGPDASFDGTTGVLEGGQVLASSQSNDLTVTATTNQSQVRLSADQLRISSVGGSVRSFAIDGSRVSQSGNSSLTTALANSVVNSLSSGANAANVDASTQLGNTQINTGGVTAIGSSEVSVIASGRGNLNPTGIGGSSVDISGNVSSSSALGNQAQNTLAATGGIITSGDLGVGSGNATVDAQASGVLASAGNLLLSGQINSGAITSNNTDNNVSIDARAETGSNAAASDSTLSVSGNAVEALATANLARNNSVNGDGATATTQATGIVGNFQFNDVPAAVIASASATIGVTLNGDGAAGALTRGTADVSSNSVQALGRGNVSQNVLNAVGANVGTGSANASTSSNGVSNGILNASFGVFNEQDQRSTVDVSVLNATLRVDATSGTGQALNGTSANVSGNSVQASGVGNVATNSVTLTALNGTGSNAATAAIYNDQTNSGNVTSSATGASIGVFSNNGFVTASSASVAGNSISSRATGNFSRSTVTRTNR